MKGSTDYVIALDFSGYPTNTTLSRARMHGDANGCRRPFVSLQSRLELSFAWQECT
jgi:hypothetical protein